MAPPLPRQPVRGSSTGRPIMAALDLLGRRWCLRILWELRGPSLTFRALQGAAVILLLSVLYAGFRELTAVQALFFGIKAAVLAMVIEAEIGRASCRERVCQYV